MCVVPDPETAADPRTGRCGGTYFIEPLDTFRMTETEDVRARLADCKPQLAATYPIDELGIFGSYARGEHDSDSDLDVLVTFTEPVSLFELVRLEAELTERLGVEVDLVTKESLKPRIGDAIAEDVRYV